MSTYTNTFTPTFLYIKRHKVTGLMYFGKTIKRNPQKYPGSGTYWWSHVSTHGKEHVETIWFREFTNKEDIVEFATFFSEFHDIVKSVRWANLMTEDGIGVSYKGRLKMFGRKCSAETKRRMSESRKQRVHSDEAKKQMSLAAKKRWARKRIEKEKQLSLQAS